MKTWKMKLILFAFFSLVLMPHLSYAAGQAIPLTDNTALYTVNFNFYAEKEDYYIPIRTITAWDPGSPSRSAGYNVFEGEDELWLSSVEESNGVILSQQPIINGQYYIIKAGTRGNFTLLTLVTMPESDLTGNYHVELTHLPYRIGNTWTTIPVDQLGDFSSPAVVLNSHFEKQ